MNRCMYYTDFKEYLIESELEDFCDPVGADVTVSTIHKAKGREFNEVFMLVSDGFRFNEEQIRRYYVGMTRAKRNLFIYTNTGYFDKGPSSTEYKSDRNDYPLPEKVLLQLTHKDVVLSFFISRKREVLSLVGGDRLEYENGYLINPKTSHPIAKLSTKMLENLEMWLEKGYSVQSACVTFVVAWKPKDAPEDQKETAVLLPEMTLSSRE